MISSVTLPATTFRYGVWMNPNSDTVAHLDRRTLPRQPACAERRQAPAMGEAGQRVRLVHELRQLRRAEELLHGGHDGPDVDDRLRRDRVDVFRRHPIADNKLHAVA